MITRTILIMVLELSDKICGVLSCSRFNLKPYQPKIVVMVKTNVKNDRRFMSKLGTHAA